MAYIKSGIILIWPGSNATIPTGWTRETSLDSKNLKGTANGVNPNVTGGADTHTHTSPVHTHAAGAHRHYGQSTRDSEYETHGGGNPDCARDAHVHDYDFTTTPSGGDLNDAITYQAGNSVPPYRKVIFIKPSGNWASLQNGVVALWNSATLPTDWSFPDALKNRYLRGAAAGADADLVTDNGSLAHSHDVSHTHTARTHSHSGGSGYDSDSGNRTRSDNYGGAGSVIPRHTHTVYLNAYTAESGSAYSGTVNGDGATEPLYKKLIAIKNDTGRVNQPRFIIGMFLGALNAIPFGWRLCDGTNGTPDMRGYHLKIANATGELGNTGGSNTHTHGASNSHNHTTGSAHTHTGSLSYAGNSYGSNADNDGAAKPHSHNVNTCSTATSTWGNTTISGDSSNNEPAYRTVAFVQYYRSAVGAAAMLL